MAEKMKEVVDLVNDLDDLDKAAWGEIVDRTESKVQERLEAAVRDGAELAVELWKEILPFVKLVRLGLASDTISRVDRCRLVGMFIHEVSALLSPVELAGICFTTAFKTLYISSQMRMMPIAIPFSFPFGVEIERKKDESRTVV